MFSLDREVQENFATGGPFNPLVSGGSILVAKDNSSDVPVLVRFGMDGDRERIPLAVPGAHRITIFGLAGSSDTTIAATGSAYSDDGRATTFLIRIHADRKRQTVTQVGPYVPKAITLAADGTLWSIGWIRDAGGDLNTTS